MNRKNIREVAFYILAVVVLSLCSVISVSLMTRAIPPENVQAVSIMLGLVLGWGGSVVGYFYGSSKGSSDKTEAMTENKESKNG